MINVKIFYPSLLEINKLLRKKAKINIYHVEYITMKSLDDMNIDTENSLYLIFNNVDGYIIEESNGDKNLIFAFKDENKEILKKYTKLWNETKNQIKTINGGKPIEYKKDFMKIRFESDNDLPLGKIISTPSMITVTRSVLQEYNKYYPQVYLHECLYKFVEEL